MPDFDSAWREFLRDTLGPIIFIVVIALIALRAARLIVRGFVGAVFDRERRQGSARALTADEIARRRETIETLGARVIQAFIVVIAVLMILSEVNLDIGPAIAGLGVVGIAVGFGAQALVRDYFNGMLILLENQFSIGDVVTIAGVTGTVEDLTLRRTTLRDLDGVVHTVPNGEIKVASNRTRTWARINQDVTARTAPTSIAQSRWSTRRDARWPKTPPGMAASSSRRMSNASRRWPSTGSRSRSLAPCSPWISGRRAGSCASDCSRRFRRTASRSRGRSA
jgi:small-conductance mechanosensitive channel